MFRMITLILVCSLMGGCSALPAEERSFAVALGISRNDDAWEVSARIPGYQPEGGYLTLTEHGDSLQEALAHLDAAAPMRMHFGQVRLLIFSLETAKSEEFPALLETIVKRADMRLQAEVCVSRENVVALMDCLEPQTGTRLSKSLDVLLETRHRLGVIPEASLSSLMRMGQRQCPVVLSVSMEKDGVQLSGGWMVNSQGQVEAELLPEEIQVLALMQNRLRKTTLMLPDGMVTLTDAGSSISLDGNSAACTLTLHCTTSELSKEGVQQQVEQTVQALVEKLATADCDAFGLGGYAIRHFRDMAAWEQLNWPQVYQQLTWKIKVQAQLPA